MRLESVTFGYPFKNWLSSMIIIIDGRVSNSPGFEQSEESISLFLGVLGIKIIFLGVPWGFEESIY